MLSDSTSNWKEAHLQHIVNSRLPETQRLEYKRQMSLSKPSDKREAAKDVASMANGIGGRLVLGLVEEPQPDGSRIPVAIRPIEDGGFAERLEDVLLSHCQPNVVAVLHRVEVEGGYCIVIDVEPSALPVMVISGGDNRYYKRVNFKAVPMDEREVRERYERGLRTLDTVERIIGKARVLDGLTDQEFIALQQTGRMNRPPALRIVAAPLFAGGEVFDASMGRLALSALGDEYWGDWGLEPRAFGLEARVGRSAPFFVLRAHRSGVVELHRHFHQYDLSATRTRSYMVALEEAAVLRHEVVLLARLYERAGYHQQIELRAEYRWLSGFSLIGEKQRSYGDVASEPAAFILRTTPGFLARQPDDVVVPLLDRVWQAAENRRCEPLHPTP